ncbi:hypothetical protein M501DRAFT_991361 [Patellaria atrata CBS 101060]|uniref:Uncharacterized protein n=1 Tax=Patellaria atrata CBS 101060 TaxID=1346257 RepID=A0A9P4SCW7_9PEZI|nr:hypothetical protein M501DRAFT_991361 [Patellaria atrata CBS 101060]
MTLRGSYTAFPIELRIAFVAFSKFVTGVMFAWGYWKVSPSSWLLPASLLHTLQSLFSPALIHLDRLTPEFYLAEQLFDAILLLVISIPVTVDLARFAQHEQREGNGRDALTLRGQAAILIFGVIVVAILGVGLGSWWVETVKKRKEDWVRNRGIEGRVEQKQRLSVQDEESELHDGTKEQITQALEQCT